MGNLDSLELDQKPGYYPAPLHLKVLSAFEGKLYFELLGKNPTKESKLYKGILKLSSPRTYHIKFLYENPLGEEKHFGPFTYHLSPPKGFSQTLPKPNIPGGVYDSILLLKFPPIEKVRILVGLNDSLALKEYQGEEIMLDKSATLYYQGRYSDDLATQIFRENYTLLLEPPRISLLTEKRSFNFEPKLIVKMEKAVEGFYSTDPLAPFSKFEKIKEHIDLPEGRHNLRLIAKNLAGTQSEVFQTVITVDKTPPDVKYFVDRATKSAVLKANEPAKIFYTTDMSTPNISSSQYRSPIKLPLNGVIPIRFFAVDTLGNESTLMGFRASSDIDPPKVEVSHESRVYKEPFDLVIKCSEPCIVKYTLNENSISYYQSRKNEGFLNIRISREGPNLLEFTAKDEPGNATEPVSLNLGIDTRPPVLTYNIRKLAENNNSSVKLKSNEPAQIFYTLDGSDPSPGSRRYAGEVELPPGTAFKYIAVDSLGNSTEALSLTDLLNPTISITPPGGIFSSTINIALKPNREGKIIWKYTKDGKDYTNFSPYSGPIVLQYSGTYLLQYYLESEQDKGTREEMYIIDKNPPQILPVLEKSLIGKTYSLRFLLNEPAIIRYTLDGSDPLLETAQVMGGVLKIDDSFLTIERKEKQVLRYLAIDRADNRSASYSLDLFSPYVTAQPPPGKYNNILTVELASQPGNTIYFSRDSLSLSPKSPVYKEPIVLTESGEIWFYSMDITGFYGDKKKARYVLNFPPEASFSTPKEFNYENSPVVLDGSLSIDQETPQKDLIYRWDFDGDGVFDTQDLSEAAISHVFKSPGEYQVTLEVQDKHELTGAVTNIVKIYQSCPEDMVTLTLSNQSFCMDRYEWPNDPKEKVTSSVNWAQASMMCIEKGKRLCTQQEWRAACKGKWDHFFSYGNQYQKEVCNTQSESARPGEAFKNCRSEEGVYQLVGNLWEWVSDLQEKEHVIVGGSYLQSASASCELSFPIQISTQAEEVGFRCCQ